MIKKRIIAIVAVLFSPLLAYAVTVNTGNVTLILPTDSSQYTLTADQNIFDSLTINNADFEFSLAGGQELLIKSADKKNFTSTLAGSLDCQSSQSVFSVSKPEGESAVTVTITPSGTCNTSSGGGGTSPSVGGGGGGGGGGTYTPPPAPPAPTPAPVPAPAPVVVSPSAPAVIPPAYGLFAREMDPGDKNDEVRRLQELLKTDPELYPEGIVSGYYGPLTINAVRKFQLKYGVIQKATDLGNGRVGPKTRAKLAEIFGAGKTQPAAPAAPTSPVSVTKSSIFNRDLNAGERGDDVKKLQELLASDPTIYPDGRVTGYYGPLTTDAIRRFQLKYGVIQKATDLGNGRVGPKTRAKLAEIFGEK